MIKLLALDFREVELAEGVTLVMERPVKHPDNPLFIADEPWENGNMQLYGSVVKVEGRPFQLWYSVISKDWHMSLAYAESDDGITWRRPEMEIFTHEGKKTNIVFTPDPHGPAIIYDRDEPREAWKYKMVAGVEPSHCIQAFHSPDGIHWQPARPYPAIGTNPDCPMGFLRARDGRYVIYHRLQGFGRRVFRSESWDFVYWSGEPRMVLEPGPTDPPQLQFYGMGSAPYGPYEIGSLWLYHTFADDKGSSKMNGFQETEFTYARSGHAWHRPMPMKPFIPHGKKGTWEQGNLQCASSPVYLDNEIRYYYMGTTQRHSTRWELEPQKAGLGMATLKPDRFMAFKMGQEAEMLTVSFDLPKSALFLNAQTEKDGWVKVEILDAGGKVDPDYKLDKCQVIRGDSTDHPVIWEDQSVPLPGRSRVRIVGSQAKIYSLFAIEPGEVPEYNRFQALW